MRASDATALRLIQAGRIQADPDTGVIAVDGTPRGYNTHGYQRIHAAGQNMMAHRVMWLYVHGHIPDGHVINHRDGNRKNNRITNLEAVTQRQNLHHARRHAAYNGTYPGDAVDAGLASRAARLATQPTITREDVLALLGITTDPEPADTATIMQEPPGVS